MSQKQAAYDLTGEIIAFYDVSEESRARRREGD
ncbi:hypothetical protein OKW35_001800 [Paraburkholderia sp. MM5477-R1]